VVRPTFLCLLVCLVVSGMRSGETFAQTSLGGQRVATSSGTFLKIGVDARASALGGAYTALAEGSLAAFTNPAGLAGVPQMETAFGYARWPADIDIAGFSFARPWGETGATFCVSAEYVGTTMEETTEYHPQGTGRTFSYSDILLGFSAARPFSDRLSIGGTMKFFREDLGSDVGGPTIQGWLADAGTVYQIGAMDAKLAIALLHFGPDLQPEGSYWSSVQGDEIDYAAFSPPTTFRVGLSFEAYGRGPHVLTTATEVAHVSDNKEALRAGVEYDYSGRYFVRGGFDTGADVAKFSGGLGLKIPWGKSHMRIDYAYTDGGPLLAIHRWSVVLPL